MIYDIKNSILFKWLNFCFEVKGKNCILLGGFLVLSEMVEKILIVLYGLLLKEPNKDMI